MVYRPPHVRVESIANNRIINISEEDRIVAIVGPGPTTRSVTDEAVTRVSGSAPSIDRLANSKVTVTKVAAYPGATGSYGNWSGNYIWVPGTGGTDTGAILWMSGSSGNGQPRDGETYYVTYTYPVPTTQYNPQLFVDSGDIENIYGIEASATGAITTGAKIVLENGAPAVMCLQISGSVDSSLVWTNTLNKLKKKDMVSYVVPLASGSNSDDVRTAVLTHCLNESSPDIGHEREAVFGLTYGDNMSVDSYISTATAFSNKRAILVTPGIGVTRTLSDGRVKVLDGDYCAAAVAGAVTAQEKPIYPITGKIIVGIEIPDDQYEPYDMNRMGAVGVCVLYSKSGVIKCRHAMTTDTASADTEEISVVAADDLVRRITRNKLEDQFLGKGIVVNPNTSRNVEAAVRAIWGQLVRNGSIYAFGTKNDPTTGEVPISAVQDSSEPRKILVTGSIKYLYPLNYINVSFYTYV